MLPRIATVRQMASLLAAQYTGLATLQLVSEKWAYNFIKYYNDL